MSSSRPYLVRALVEWINDNDLTPHLQVDARMPGVRVPAFAVRDGKVTLNIAPRAVVQLQIGNDSISFQARFGGVSHVVRVPIEAVEAVYARENGQGMAFPTEIAGEAHADSGVEESSDATPAPGEAPASQEAGDDAPPPKRPPHLRVIK